MWILDEEDKNTYKTWIVDDDDTQNYNVWSLDEEDNNIYQISEEKDELSSLSPTEITDQTEKEELNKSFSSSDAGRPQTYAGQFLAGATDPLSSALKGLSTEEWRKDYERLQRQISGEQLSPMDMFSILGDAPRIIEPSVEEVTELQESDIWKSVAEQNKEATAKLVANLPQFRDWYKKGDYLQKTIDNLIEQNPEYTEEFGGKVFRGLGQFGSMAVTQFSLSKIPGIRMGGQAIPLMNTVYLGQNLEAVNNFEQSLDEFNDIDKAFDAYEAGRASGTLEVIPISNFLKRLPSDAKNKVRDSFKVLLGNATKAGSEGAIENAIQEIIQQTLYNVSQGKDQLENTGEAASVGGTVGAIMNFVGSLIAGRRTPAANLSKEWAKEVKRTDLPSVDARVFFSPEMAQEELTPRQQAQADPLPYESPSKVRQLYESGARLTYRKPLAALDPIVEWFDKYPETKPIDIETGELYNPALELKKRIEHPDTFSGVGGLNRADWFEQKTAFIGEVRSPIDRVFDKYRTRIGKRLNKRFNTDVRNMSMDLISGQSLDPRDIWTDYQKIAFRHDDPAMEKAAYSRLTKEQQYEVDVFNAALEIQESLEKTYGTLKDIGIDVASETGEHIFPQVLDMSSVRDDIQGFKKFLQEQSGFQEDINAVNTFFDQLVRNRGNISTTLGDVKSIGQTTEEGFERVRRINVPEKYLEKDLDKIITNYINQAANKIATGRALGKEVEDPETGEISYDPLGKYKNLMSDIQEGLRRGGKVPDPEMLDDVRSVVEGLQGRYNPIKHPTKARMMRGLSTFETASHLTGATISSIVEPFLGIPRAGLGNFIKAIPGLLNHMVHGLPRILSPRLANKARATIEAEQVGNALDSVSMELLTAGFTTEYSNLTELFFRSPLGLWLHQFTRSMRVFSVSMGLQKMQGWMNTINKDAMKGKQREYFKKQIKDLGISPKEFEGISRLARDLFGGKIDLLNEDFMDMRINKYGGYNLNEGIKVRDLLNPALVRFTNDIVMAPRITNKPLNTSDPHYSWASLFWSYPITFSNTVLKQWKNRIKNPCTPKAQFFAEMVGMLAAMYGLATLVNEVKNIRRTGESDFEGSEELVIPAFEDTSFESITPTEETYRNIESTISYHVPGKPAVLNDIDNLSRDFTDYMDDKIEGEELIAKLYDFMTQWTQNIDWMRGHDEGVWGEREEMREDIIEALE